MARKSLRCRLGFHLYEPYQQPTTHGLMTEAPCQCLRCGHTLVVQMWFTDELYAKWDQRIARRIV